MLDETLTPSVLIARTERQPIEIRSQEPARSFAFFKVVYLFARHSFVQTVRRLRGRFDADAAAVELRQIFENLGGLWIKIGQLLSLRSDVLSKETCRELSALQYRVIGFPMEEVTAILNQAYGGDFDKIFQYFETKPLAAASISQVHLALLRDPAVMVAVKVRRPQVDRDFNRDLRHFDRIVRLLEFFGIGRHLHLRDALWELQEMVREELDFRYEAANTRRMRKTLKKHDIIVPRVFQDYSSQHVLVTEYVEGLLMSDFIRIGQQDPKRLALWCEDNDIDPQRVGGHLFRSALRQLLEDNLFHADFHPGNIILLRNDRIALIDFGTIGYCERGFLLNYKMSLRAMAQKDFAKAADLAIRFAISPPSLAAVKDLHADLVRCYREWEGRTHLRGLGYHERSLGAAGTASGRIMYNYKVQLSWTFMRISRTWATLDASLNYLIPDANYVDLFEDYFRLAQRRRMQPGRVLRQTLHGIRTATTQIEEYNLALDQFVRRNSMMSSVVGSTSERLVRAASAAMGFVRTSLTVALVGAILVFLTLYHDYLMPDVAEPTFDKYAEILSHVPEHWWWVIFALLVFAILGFRRVIRSLENRP